MYYEPDTGYYEPSEIEEILSEFKERCSAVLEENINSKIGVIKHENKYLKEENETLKTSLSDAERSLRRVKKELEDCSLMGVFADKLKANIKNSDDKDREIYSFLNLMFKKDYKEDVSDIYEAPLWLGALTQFYSNKDTILEIFRFFDIKLPNNVENFRLPVDWNEEELDIFFSTMRNHHNCNGCIYNGNLRFWCGNSLKSVEAQCNQNYSEIPWQYVLRNPLLKKEKFLKEIGKNAFNTCTNWKNFYKIDEYLELTDDEIKTILCNIDYTKLKRKGSVEEFVLKHLKLIADENFLDKVYSTFCDSYEFRYESKILDMPYKYVLKFATKLKKDAISFVDDSRNENKLTEEQRKEFLRVALGL